MLGKGGIRRISDNGKMQFKKSHRGGRSEPAGWHGLRKQVTDAKESSKRKELLRKKGKENAPRRRRGRKVVCMFHRERERELGLSL